MEATQGEREMSKDVVRSCPKCKGDLAIVLPDRQRRARISAINGRCVNCGYRLAWILIQGKRAAFRNRQSLFLS